MDYKINQSDVERLSKFLGECVHELNTKGLVVGGKMYCLKCGASPYTREYKPPRTFNTIQDRQDLFERLKKEGKWHWFRVFWIGVWDVDRHTTTAEDYFDWLFVDNPERACKLVSIFFWNRKV